VYADEVVANKLKCQIVYSKNTVSLDSDL